MDTEASNPRIMVNRIEKINILIEHAATYVFQVKRLLQLLGEMLLQYQLVSLWMLSKGQYKTEAEDTLIIVNRCKI